MYALTNQVFTSVTVDILKKINNSWHRQLFAYFVSATTNLNCMLEHDKTYCVILYNKASHSWNLLYFKII